MYVWGGGGEGKGEGKVGVKERQEESAGKVCRRQVWRSTRGFFTFATATSSWIAFFPGVSFSSSYTLRFYIRQDILFFSLMRGGDV